MINRQLNNTYSFNKLRLHSSEKNSSWSDVFDDFKNNLSDNDIKFYPNTIELIEPLFNLYNTENFLIGFGSDRCIKYFFELNSKINKKLIITNPSFPMYKVYGEIFDMNVCEVPYKTLNFPLDEIIKNITTDSIVVISNPSSPIGNIISEEDLETILNIGVPTLIDEAYIEFSEEESIISKIEKYNNLYVTRTFSKAFGSAGVRFGLIFSNKNNIEKLNQFRDMYEMTGLSLRWILTLLKNINKVYEYINDVKCNRLKLFYLFNKCGYQVISSNCNWIYIKGLDINEFRNSIIFKENCYLPNLGNDWIRLQITDKIDDYKCLLK